MIWLGLRIQDQPVWAFLLIAVAALAVLTLWGAALEKATNALVDRLLPTKKPAAAPPMPPVATPANAGVS